MSPGRPVWLPVSAGPLHGELHEPGPAAAGRTAVLLLAPFGWEDICSYRARRIWATALAGAGFPTLRVDLPGTGDSAGSPYDRDLVARWVRAIEQAAGWLRERTGADRVAALGIALGGLLGWQAAAGGAPIDDLALWGVPARGRALVRGLRAYSGVIASRSADRERGPAPEDGAVELAGFTMTADTVAALGAIRLEATPLPGAASRRLLLIERDGLGVDEALRASAEASGAEVTVAPAADYAIMMTHPSEAWMPDATIALTVGWVSAGDARTAPVGAAASAAASSGAAASAAAPPGSVRIAVAGGAVTESFVELATPAGRSFGVRCEPVGVPRRDVCAVMHNAGAIRRVGPNRMWVELARRWARLGVPSVRFDLEGLGDSDGDHRPYEDDTYTFRPEATAELVAMLDRLQADGAADRFAVVGMCSGAYACFQAALRDERVAAAFMVNTYALFFTDALHAERHRRRLLGESRAWLAQAVRRRPLPVLEKRRTLQAYRELLAQPRLYAQERGQAGEIRAALDTLRGRGTRVGLLLSYTEPLIDQLDRTGVLRDLGRWPNLALERLPSGDHDLRALWVQGDVHARLDRGLGKLLGTAA